MRWSERQLAMLREMGIRVWAPEAPSAMARRGRRDGGRRAPGGAGVVLAAAPVARAPAAACERGADRPAPVRRPGAATADVPIGARRWPAPSGSSSASRSHRPLPIRPPRPSRSCCSTTCCARSGSRAACAGARRPGLPPGGRRRSAAPRSMPRSPPCSRAASSRSAASPAAALLGVDEPLGKLREQVHERAGIPVVVTFALPYLLRHAADKPRAWADLCRAVAAIG